MSRDVEIDIAKGLGIFMIVFGHVSQWGMDMPAVSFFFGVFAVPMFFFLSGIFYRPDRPLGQTAKSKLKRLYLPFLIANFLALLFEFLCGEETSPLKDALLILAGVKIMPKVGPSWFLLVLFWSSLLYNLADTCLCKRKILLTIVCTIAFLAGLLLPDKYFIGQILTATFLYHCGRISSELGVKRILIGVHTRWKWLIAMVCAVLVFFISRANGSSMYSNEYGNPLLFLAGAAAGTIFISYVSHVFATSGFLSKSFSVIGRGSLWILLMHFSVIMGVFIVHGFMIDHDMPFCSAPMAVWYGLCLILSIVLPVAFQAIWRWASDGISACSK